jgi:hypothetical protein
MSKFRGRDRVKWPPHPASDLGSVGGDEAASNGLFIGAAAPTIAGYVSDSGNLATSTRALEGRQLIS